MSSRPDVYLDDGRWYFRASSIGACLRGLVAARKGISPQPPMPGLQRAMRASGDAEQVVREQLQKRGWKVEPGESVSYDCEEYGLLTGNTDGFISGEGLDRCVLEIKALGRDLFQRYVRGGIQAMGEPFTRMYGMQISAYMLSTGLPCLVAVYGKDSDTTLEKLYEEPPYSTDDLCERMGQVHSFVERKLWPECDAKCNSSSWYWHIHEEKEKNRITDEEMEQKVAKAAQLKATITALEDEYKKLADELKDELGRGAHTVGRHFSVNVVQMMQHRTDLDRLRRDMGEEFLEAYQYDFPVTQLRIKDKRRGKDG